MHILHLIQAYGRELGGGPRYFQEISERLVREGHSVTVWTTNALESEYFWNRRKPHLPAGREVIAGVVVERFPVRHLPWHWKTCRLLGLVGPAALRPWVEPPTPLLPALWRRTLRPPPVDLVHASGLPLDSIMQAGFQVARRRRVPYLTTPLIHFGRGNAADAAETDRFYQRPHQRRFLRESAVVFVQSRAEADFVAAQGVSRERIQLLGMGIDPVALQGGVAERFRQRVGFREPLVLHIAGKALAKGSADLVEAMKRLWDRGCPARLVLLGRSMNDFARYFEPQAAALRGRCFDLGFVDEETKKDALAACDLFAMPSKADSFGIVYLEAWFYGKPVIGARAGGVPDLIEDGQDGLLVEFGDVPALAAAIEHLLHNPAQAAAMGARGRQKVLSRYTWEHKYALLRECYERCVRREGTQGITPHASRITR